MKMTVLQLQNTSALIPYKWRRYPKCTLILVSVTSPDKDRYIEKMVLIVPYQFELESDDETVEVADRQETDSQERLELDVSQW